MIRVRAGRARSRLALVAAVGALGLIAPSAASAQVQFEAPQFAGERDTIGLSELATDPFGNLYATGGDLGLSTQLLKFQPDLTPVFDKQIGDGEPIASDSAGRLFVAGFSKLRQYTSNAGLLGEWPISGGYKGGMSSDSTDHLYLPDFDGGAPVLNEYAVVAGTPTVVASTPYVGTPNDGFIPTTFFESAVDAERDVYASGVTEAPDTRFLHRYGPDLTGAPFVLKSCASPCGWVNGLDVARLQTSGGGGAADFLIADNYPSHTIQVYSTGAGGEPAGSFPVEVTPGSPTMIPVDFASSDCTGSLYILLTLFGGPGTTFSGSRIQRYDTGASTGPCPAPPLAKISGLDKQKYKLVPKLGADGPCIPCVLLGKSGAEARARPAGEPATGAEAVKRARGKGLKLKFESTATADVSFLFRGPTEAKGKPKKRGGFLYAAVAGKNKLKFTGLLKKRKPLPPGTYKTTVSDAAGQTLEKFKTKVLES